MSLPFLRFSFKEFRHVDENGRENGGQDVEPGPLLRPPAASATLIVEREADGEIALDGHGHHHVDGRAQRDPIERVVKVGKHV